MKVHVLLVFHCTSFAASADTLIVCLLGWFLLCASLKLLMLEFMWRLLSYGFYSSSLFFKTFFFLYSRCGCGSANDLVCGLWTVDCGCMYGWTVCVYAGRLNQFVECSMFNPIFETIPCADNGNSIPIDCIDMSYCSSIRWVDDRSFLRGVHMHA